MQKKILIFFLLALCFLTSCTEKTAEKTEDQDTSISQIIENYGGHKKETYGFLPIYNIDKSQCFELKFNALPEDLSEAVSVYRGTVEPRNEVKVELLQIEKNREQYLVIIPKEKAKDENTGKFQSCWGQSGSYYIRINYDFESPTLQKLQFPAYIYFTLRSEVEVPEVKHQIDEKGNITLFWDEDNAALQYKIYKRDKDNQLKLVGTTLMPEWSLSQMSQNKGLVYTSQFITEQNNNVAGEYFVSAFRKEKESLLSNDIDISDMGRYIPTVVEDDIFGRTYNSLNELPESVKVTTLSGDYIEKKVLYDFEGINQNNLTTGFEVNYSIQDTELTGYVQVKYATVQEVTGYITMETYANKIKQPFCIAGGVPIQNKTKKYSAVQIKQTDCDRKILSVDQFLVRSKGEKKIESCVPDIPEDYIFYSTSPLEEYLVRFLINNKSVIDLSDFPETNNPYYLECIMEKVIYNNPLILGVKSYSFSFETQQLRVTYYDSKEKPWTDKQKELVAWVQSYAEEIVVPEGKTIERVLYDYIVENCPYDQEALENAKASGYYNIESQFSNSFNAYGTLIKHTGTPSGYAAAYKLLCDYCGIKSRVVVGNYKDIKHTWNAINLSGEWGYVDVSNNYISCGIPYPVFNISAECLPQEYSLKEECLDIGRMPDLNITAKDHYESEGLLFSSKEELMDTLDKMIKNKENYFVLKNNTEFSDSDMCSVIAEKIHELVTEKEFNEFYIGKKSGFIIVASSGKKSSIDRFPR